jgi:cysteine desulfurase/selenocysteine lyase
MVSPPLDRSLFAVTDTARYLNHAAAGTLSRPAVEAGIGFLHEHATLGAVGFTDWEARVEVVRGSAATLLGVAATDLAFVKNTTEGLSFVANGLSWRPGDRVLVADREFPSTIYPWLSLRDRDVVVDVLEPVGAGWTLPIERFDEHLRARPARVVAVSWVQFARGFRTDLAELARVCHEHGALLCVDAIQGLGVIPAELEAWGVDFAATDAYKWMLGPFGTGVLYVRRTNRDLLRPLEPGYLSVAHRERYDHLELVYDDSARRFEGGSLTTEAILQMGASIDLLLETGVDAVWRHVDGLLDHLVDRVGETRATVVSDRSATGRSAIVTLTLDGHDPTQVVDQLRAAGVVCSARGDGLRVSPHGYNTLDEIDDLIDALVPIVHR